MSRPRWIPKSLVGCGLTCDLSWFPDTIKSLERCVHQLLLEMNQTKFESEIEYKFIRTMVNELVGGLFDAHPRAIHRARRRLQKLNWCCCSDRHPVRVIGHVVVDVDVKQYEDDVDRYSYNYPFAGGCRRIGPVTTSSPVKQYIRFEPKYEIFREIDGDHQYVPGVSFDQDII
jgi:hypothetical protein